MKKKTNKSIPVVFTVNENKQFFYGRRYGSNDFEKVKATDKSDFAESKFAVNTPHGTDIIAGNRYDLPCKGYYNRHGELVLLNKRRKR